MTTSYRARLWFFIEPACEIFWHNRASLSNQLRSSPGMIASPFNKKFSEREETGSAWANDKLVGRWGNPEDINGAVVFLASD